MFLLIDPTNQAHVAACAYILSRNVSEVGSCRTIYLFFVPGYGNYVWEFSFFGFDSVDVRDDT